MHLLVQNTYESEFAEFTLLVCVGSAFETAEIYLEVAMRITRLINMKIRKL